MGLIEKIWLQRLVFVLILFTSALGGFIDTQRVQVSYNYQGGANSYSLNFRLQSGLASTEYIQFTWPFTLGTSAQVTANLINYQTNLLLKSGVTPTVSGTVYTFAFSVTLDAMNWYKVVFNTQIIQTPGLITTPVQIATISSTAANSIQYDYTTTVNNFFIAPSISTATLKILVTLQKLDGTNNNAGNSFFIYIDITPSKASQAGGQIVYINIDKGANADGSSGTDFTFIGNCLSVELLCGDTTSDSCQNIPEVKSSCAIQPSMNQIIFDHQQGWAVGQTFRIQTQVQNPLFQSTRDLQIFTTSKIDGRVFEIGSKLKVFSVSTIALKAGRKKFLWGIDSTEPITGISFKLFKQQSAGILGPINSVSVSFYTYTGIPEGAQLQLLMDFGCTGLLEGSIVNNLPSYDKINPVACSFNSGKVQCSNIGSLTSNTTEYFIAAKIYYANDASNPAAYGAITISSIAYDSTGTLIAGATLYQALAGSAITLTTNTEYLDSGASGWHDIANSGMGTTQIVTYYDDNTLSATPNAIANFLRSTNSGVGIFPNVDSDQQLLFFLKVTSAQVNSILEFSTLLSKQALLPHYIKEFC